MAKKINETEEITKSFVIYAEGERIVSDFEITAESEEEVERLANLRFEEFQDSLRLEEE
jgi:hypothetical protein